MDHKENSSPQTKEYLAELWKEYRDHFESEGDFLHTVAVWPVCPECGRRREVVCPVCHRSRDLFPPADDDFWFASNDAASVGSEAAASCCSCGSACGSPHGGASRETVTSDGASVSESSEIVPRTSDESDRRSAEDFAASAGQTAADDQNTVWRFSEPGTDSEPGGNYSAASDSIYTARTFSVSTPNYHRSTIETLDMIPEKRPSAEDLSRKFHKEGLRLVICPTCDEPFVPKYLPVCKGCGRRFDDSLTASEEPAISDADESFPEAAGGRVALMAAGMVILAILFVFFLLFFVK